MKSRIQSSALKLRRPPAFVQPKPLGSKTSVATMTRRPRSIIVVGASAAGHSCASTLRRLGFDGALTLLGAESHLPYQRPPLSKLFLAGKLDRSRLDLRRDEALDGNLCR